MSPEKWHRVEQLYHSALDRSPSQRVTFLAHACEGDDELRREVESLLDQKVSSDGVLEQPAWARAGQLLEEAAPTEVCEGAQLGPYRIETPLGAGGMGEVYRATDTRLGRQVAIKVSARQFSGRFEREARAISALNHPHVCTLYDIGPNYLVMELIEGETLAARMDKGRLPLNLVLRYAAEIADALAAAHARGIVHRDLKPANIMVTKTGIKVLDFGLAKIAIAPVAGETITQTGTILGTVQYMSPEQLEGKDADARADIFAFGAVVYEMATGEKAFPGQSQASVVAAIMRSDPPQAALPSPLDQLLQKCLAKDPEERWQNARDLATALKWVGPGAAAEQRAVPWFAKRRSPWIIAAMSAILALAFAVAYLRRPQPEEAAVQRFSIPLALRPGDTTPGTRGFALSPDGRSLAYNAATIGRRRQLWIRPFDSLIPQPLPGTEGVVSAPFWSPDNHWLGFFANGKLKKIEVWPKIGPVLEVCDAPKPSGGTWNSDGVIVFAPQLEGELYRVAATGGTPVRLTALDESRNETMHGYPHFLPDGRHVVFGVKVGFPFAFIGVVSLDAPAPVKATRLVDATSQAAYAPAPVGPLGDGFLIFMRGTTLFAQPFDAAILKTAGDPLPLPESVRTVVGSGDYGRFWAFSVSSNGMLATESQSGLSRQLVWLERNGRALDVLPSAPAGETSGIQLSPNQSHLALFRIDPQARRNQIWLIDLARGVPAQIKFEGINVFNPLWSSDGSRIVFGSGRPPQGTRLYQKDANGAGNPEILLESPGTTMPTDWSRDGRFVAFDAVKDKTGYDIWILPMTGDRTPYPFLETSVEDSRAHFSPDGRWLAYQSAEAGTLEVYIQAFNPPGQPARSGKWQISSDGGSLPRWRRNGKELFFRRGGTREMMSVEIGVTSSGQLLPGTPKLLFETALVGNMGDYYDVTPDGQRFLVNRPTEDPASTSITVVLNWTAGLKR